MDAETVIVAGTSEVDTALVLLNRSPRQEQRRTFGGDKLHDQQRFVEGAQARKFTPHVAQNTTNRRSAIDGRTRTHPGYEVSKRKRKLVEQGIGWKKTIGLLRKLRHRGIDNVDLQAPASGDRQC